MPGFLITNYKNVDIKESSCYVSEKSYINNFMVNRQCLRKFLDEKVLVQNSDIVCVSEGVLLNKISLYQKYNCNTIESLFYAMYRKEGDSFFDQFRGGFSGAIYIKSEDKWIIFTNHIGDSAVFCYYQSKQIIVASQINSILNICKSNGVCLTFDEQAAYQMLTYGFMADNATYSCEIKRLPAGHYIIIHKGELSVKKYFSFTKNGNRFKDLPDEKIIEELDKCFKRAVELEFKKDKEYGYKHLVDISGGLDSRMVLWVAKSLGYHDIQLINYGKAGYLDEIIAKQISYYLKADLLIKPLDDANFLYDIDENVSMNGGLALYSSITGGNRMLRSIRTDIYGIEHTGMLGDVLIGSYIKSLDIMQNHKYTGRYSDKLARKLSVKISKEYENYDDYELYLLYTRGFHGMTNTHFIRRNYIDTYSPFLDVDFIQLCLDIPIEKRINHYIYKKWILSKYPTAAKFKWEKTNSRIDSKLSTLRRYMCKGPAKVMQIFGYGNIVNTGMNPLDYWINKDSILQRYLEGYFKKAISKMSFLYSKELMDDMKFLYSTGCAWEKSMVLTVLSASQMYFR